MSNFSQGHADARRLPAFKPKLKPKGPPRWSHQRELDGLRGQKVSIFLLSGDVFRNVTVLEADQFTIKIEGNVIFKHAIALFQRAVS
jgi:hypothetical protein